MEETDNKVHLEAVTMQLEAVTIEHHNSTGSEPAGMQIEETIINPINNIKTCQVCVNENDDIKLLPGYRFNPFDYELIVHYLWNKINKQPLPHNKITEIEHLYKYDPEEITKIDQGLVENEWYFFTARDGETADGDGYWKATGDDETVYYKGVVVGHRKELVFYRGKAPKGDETNWIMHEFTVITCPSTNTSQDDTRLNDWVLCRIYRKDAKYKGPKRIHNENSASKEDSPFGAPREINFFQLPTTSQLPTPSPSNFLHNHVDEYHSPIGYGGYGLFHNSYTSLPTTLYDPPPFSSEDRIDQLMRDEPDLFKFL